MKLIFWVADKHREDMIAQAFAPAARAFGDKCEIRTLSSDEKKAPAADCDVAIMFGVKSRTLFQTHWAAGVTTVYWDKGYVRQRIPGLSERQCSFWRVAVNAHHPTHYLNDMAATCARFNTLGIQVQPWRKSGDHILYAGSSAKYHAFAGLPDPTRYGKSLIKRIRAVSDRSIVYRPKPSWHDAVPLDGAAFSRHPQRIADVLKDAHVMVTHGSNACWEAIIAGVPCLILGDAPAKPISSTDLSEINHPWIATDEERLQWLWNLAWCQWSIEEIESGAAWASIRERVVEEKKNV